MTDNKIMEQKKLDAERLAQLFGNFSEREVQALKYVAIGMMLNAQSTSDKATDSIKAAG